jgi:NAD(P)-dependent dehydrogenase (short-subunit alcohol dehydrogenase family)
MPPYSLQGKTLFITGGASGIGAEVARRAAAKGANLALVDVDGDGAARLADTLPNAIAITADVRDYDSLASAVEQSVERFGGIDLCFANAGIEIAHSARGVPLVELERIADINFTGVMRTVRATLPHVIDRRGYVLITASAAAIGHAPPLSHYSATKAGVEAFGNAVRLELRHKGVDVGVAYFSFIDTPMVARGQSDPILAKFQQEQGENFISKTYPLSGAASAVINGMETRSRRVMYPGFLRPMYALRSLMPRLLERVTKPEAIGRLIDELDARDLQSAERDASHELHDRLLS